MKNFVAFCLVNILFVPQSFGFTLISSTDSGFRGWANPSVKLMVNEANCPASVDIIGLVIEAAAAWNNVPASSIKVYYGDSTTSTTYNSAPTIYCETNFQTVTGMNQDFVIGAANVHIQSGQIYEGIIYLNASSGQGNIANFDATQAKIILAHEIGHLLGLGHTNRTEALMYYDISAKNSFRLSQDDMDGMTYLYPDNESEDGKMAGCAQVKSPQPPNFNNFFGTLLFLFIPLISFIHLRRKSLKLL